MIPNTAAGRDAARLLAELGPRLNRDERDALQEVVDAAAHRTTIDQDVMHLVGRAVRRREAGAWKT